MNLDQYIAGLQFCCKVETAGAIAGEVAMLLREDPVEKCKLDIFRRLEASNKVLCVESLEREGLTRPVVEPSLYRNGLKLGQRFGEGDWSDFLDRFEATVHPEVFVSYLFDAEGDEIQHEYEGVNLPLFRHLIRHEQSLATFVECERQGRSDESTQAMEELLASDLCSGLFGPEDPVGW